MTRHAAMRPSSQATTELRRGVLSGQAVKRLCDVLLANWHSSNLLQGQEQVSGSFPSVFHDRGFEFLVCVLLSTSCVDDFK